ncbi:MAG TPA: nucleoside permease [Planctomycetaceae bacterium]|nr:nucleoside permease [Planctomycetaceae bacterium]
MFRAYAEKFSIGQRLSVMMFLQFFIWGTWYVVGPLYLGGIGFDEADFGWMYSVGPIAGMISPFFVGMIADRFFPTEKVLGLMHLLGGAAMLYATTLMTADNPDPGMINLVFFIHMLFYFPTLALTNTLALHTMTDAESQFPVIRVFGTIGWVVAGQLISWLIWDSTINVFYLAAFSSFLLGFYSFTLPHIPPPLAGQKVTARELIGADAFVLLKHKPFLIFMVSSFLICIPLAFYYQMAARAVEQAGMDNVAGTMTYGQISEIFFMLLMPLCFRRLGVKYMLLVGMFAWVVRYILFAIGSPVDEATGVSQLQWMLLLGIVLHGICYDFFFVTGQIYTDKVAPKEIRGQAQGMLALFTLGLGMFIGAKSAGLVEGWNTPKESKALHQELLDDTQKSKQLAKELDDLLASLEQDAPEAREKFEQEAEIVEHLKGLYRGAELKTPDIPKLDHSYSMLTNKTLTPKLTEALQVQSDRNDLAAAMAKKQLDEKQLKNWRWIWLLPAIFAAAIMGAFFYTFNESEKIDSGETSPDDVEPPPEVMETLAQSSSEESTSESDSPA